MRTFDRQIVSVFRWQIVSVFCMMGHHSPPVLSHLGSFASFTESSWQVVADSFTNLTIVRPIMYIEVA